MITAILAIFVSYFDINIHGAVYILPVWLDIELISSIDYFVKRKYDNSRTQNFANDLQSSEHKPNVPEPKLSGAQAMRDSLNTGDNSNHKM